MATSASIDTLTAELEAMRCPLHLPRRPGEYSSPTLSGVLTFEPMRPVMGMTPPSRMYQKKYRTREGIYMLAPVAHDVDDTVGSTRFLLQDANQSRIRAPGSLHLLGTVALASLHSISPGICSPQTHQRARRGLCVDRYVSETMTPNFNGSS